MNKDKFLPTIIVGITLMLAGIACGSSPTEDQGIRTLVEPEEGEPAVEEKAPEPTEIKDTPTPRPSPTPEIEGLVSVGTHLIGVDIDPGIYVGLAGDNILESCYWARLSNLTGSNDILANDNAVGLFYVEVLESDKALEVNCELLPMDKVPAREEILWSLTPGVYLVGRDIEAGTYRGQAGEDILESCYWARLRNVNGDNDILANDNATGQYFIEVLPTDFALRVGCDVERIE
jgi:hypothetical protein